MSEHSDGCSALGRYNVGELQHGPCDCGLALLLDELKLLREVETQLRAVDEMASRCAKWMVLGARWPLTDEERDTLREAHKAARGALLALDAWRKR